MDELMNVGNVAVGLNSMLDEKRGKDFIMGVFAHAFISGNKLLIKELEHCETTAERAEIINNAYRERQFEEEQKQAEILQSIYSKIEPRDKEDMLKMVFDSTCIKFDGVKYGADGKPITDELGKLIPGAADTTWHTTEYVDTTAPTKIIKPDAYNKLSDADKKKYRVLRCIYLTLNDNSTKCVTNEDQGMLSIFIKHCITDYPQLVWLFAASVADPEDGDTEGGKLRKVRTAVIDNIATIPGSIFALSKNLINQISAGYISNMSHLCIAVMEALTSKAVDTNFFKSASSDDLDRYIRMAEICALDTEHQIIDMDAVSSYRDHDGRALPGYDDAGNVITSSNKNTIALQYGYLNHLSAVVSEKLMDAFCASGRPDMKDPIAKRIYVVYYKTHFSEEM